MGGDTGQGCTLQSRPARRRSIPGGCNRRVRPCSARKSAIGKPSIIERLFIARPTIFLTRGKEMSLGKAMIHARKQKSLARAAAFAGEHTALQHSLQAVHILQMPVLVLNRSEERR